MSLQVCTAKRKGEGVTVLRGYFVCEPSRSNVSRPAEAGDDGGDADGPAEVDKSVANDFLGEATRLNLRICTGPLCCVCVCCSISMSMMLARIQTPLSRRLSSSKGINGETVKHGDIDGEGYLSVFLYQVSQSLHPAVMCATPLRTWSQEPASVPSRP